MTATYTLTPDQANTAFHEERIATLRRARRLVSALLDLDEVIVSDSQDLIAMRSHNNDLYNILHSLGGDELAKLPVYRVPTPRSTGG